MVQAGKFETRSPHYMKIENELQYNKAYFSAYLNYLESESEHNSESKRQYLSSMSRFLKYLEKTETSFGEITVEKINQYSQKRKIDSVFCAALKAFIVSARSVSSVNITDNDIDQLPRKEGPDRSAAPLSINEIIEIRRTLKSRKEYQLLFIFEVFLTYGISLDQFKNLKRDDFSLNDGIFTISVNNTRILSNAIAHLMKDHKDLPIIRARGTVQSNIRKIGELIEIERDKLIWKDIAAATREQYFPVCPNCHNRYPNTDEFWALVEYQSDDDRMRWFWCRKCIKVRLEGGFNG
jgi:hypothetical protein